MHDEHHALLHAPLSTEAEVTSASCGDRISSCCSLDRKRDESRLTLRRRHAARRTWTGVSWPRLPGPDHAYPVLSPSSADCVYLTVTMPIWSSLSHYLITPTLSSVVSWPRLPGSPWSTFSAYPVLLGQSLPAFLALLGQLTTPTCSQSCNGPAYTCSFLVSCNPPLSAVSTFRYQLTTPTWCSELFFPFVDHLFIGRPTAFPATGSRDCAILGSSVLGRGRVGVLWAGTRQDGVETGRSGDVRWEMSSLQNLTFSQSI